MQAQYGLFLEAQVNIAEIWPLDRIVFPHRDGPSAIDRRHIYPDRKSALELAIDQYLLQRKRNEDFSSFMAGVDKSKVAFIQIREDASKVDVAPQIPPAWAGGARENWSDVDVDSVRPEGSIEQVGGDTAYLLDLITRRRRCTDLVQLTGPGSERLQVLLDRLWAGCRPHPYDELQLVRAVSALFSICDALRERNLASGQALAAGAAEVYAEPLEIGISAAGDNPTRAFVDAVRLEESLKPDVRASYLGRADTAADRMKLLLRERWEIPWSTFDVSSLIELFVDQIIPWQLVSGRNPVAFAPFEVRRIGRA
ncbi:hypothetical protein [Sphingomonas beigongshangi]|uniref:hypothetical protein n=1 Tax=Sphingomonas beigongshangi TaxID=2782540 RepID=UPI001AEE0E6F|nr:hypothetical protein [Sphingomonas beigongshangi]